jgi:hypothetical protein
MPSDLTKILYISKTMYDGESALWKHAKCFKKLTGNDDIRVGPHVYCLKVKVKQSHYRPGG